MPAIPRAQWVQIQTRYENGENPSSLAKDYPVSRQAIEKRARKEGWLKPNGPYHDAVQETSLARRLANPQTLSDKLVKAHNVRTPEVAERILGFIHDGATEAMAARAAGIAHPTLSKWKKEDPEFEMLLAQARYQCLARQARAIHKAGENGDWKAAAWTLERAPETRDEFFLPRSGQAGGGGITLNIKVPIPQKLEAGENAVAIDAHAQLLKMAEARDAEEGE